MAEQSQEESTEFKARPRMQVVFTRPRQYFVERQRDLKLAAREALEATVEMRPFQDPTYDLYKKEHTFSIQAAPVMESTATQTLVRRKLPLAIQVTPMVQDREPTDVDEVNLRLFLETAEANLRIPITLNSILPTHPDPLTATAVDNAGALGDGDSQQMREVYSFVHHALTKGQRIASLAVPARSNRLAAVAVVESGTLAQRAAHERTAPNFHAVLWSYSDPINPLAVLLAPSEITVLRFAPRLPSVVVGGCINGQVIAWDLSSILDASGKRASDAGRERAAAARDGTDPQRGDTAGVITVPWQQLSDVRGSHSEHVVSIIWLPEGVEFNFEGRIVKAAAGNGAHQFISVALDGTILYWDTRPTHQRRDRLRKLRAQEQSAKLPLPWAPLYRIACRKPEPQQSLRPLAAVMPRPDAPHTLYVSTDDGEVVTLDTTPPADRPGAGGMGGGGKEGEGVHAVSWIASASAHPAVAIDVWPHAPPGCERGQYVAACGGHAFGVWRMGVVAPLFTSPSHTSPVTAIKWGPRPCHLFVGTASGAIEVWDVVTRSHEPSLTQQVAQGAITCIHIRESRASRRSGVVSLSVTDDAGVLHVLDVPAHYGRGPAQDAETVLAFLQREEARAVYFTQRLVQRRRAHEEKFVAGGAEEAAVATEGTQDAGNPFMNQLNIDEWTEEFLAELEKKVE